MKSVVTIQIIIITLLLAIFSIFTIDSVSVKKAELQQVVLCDVTDIVDAYFDGDILTENLEAQIKNAIIASAHSNINSLSVSIHYADNNKDVVAFTIEETYKQPNGSYRTISTKRVYIKEVSNDAAMSPYNFTRNISKEYYKNASDAFVEETNGGLKSDSVWRTAEYASVLDLILVD